MMLLERQCRLQIFEGGHRPIAGLVEIFSSQLHGKVVGGREGVVRIVAGRAAHFSGARQGLFKKKSLSQLHQRLAARQRFGEVFRVAEIGERLCIGLRCGNGESQRHQTKNRRVPYVGSAHHALYRINFLCGLCQSLARFVNAHLTRAIAFQL
jgi:hypothetical protein